MRDQILNDQDAHLPDASIGKGVQDITLPAGLNFCQHQVLVPCQDDWQLIALNDSAQSLFGLTLEPAILYKDAICKLAVALLYPAQVVSEFPGWQWPKATLKVRYNI